MGFDSESIYSMVVSGNAICSIFGNSEKPSKNERKICLLHQDNHIGVLEATGEYARDVVRISGRPNPVPGPGERDFPLAVAEQIPDFLQQCRGGRSRVQIPGMMVEKARGVRT